MRGHSLDVTTDPIERPPDVHYRFGHDPQTPHVVREVLKPLIARHWPVVDDVLLVASELVTNVVRHTDNGGELKAWMKPGAPLRVEVCDPDPVLPAVVEPTTNGGRGLRIVAALADDWGAAPTPDGKLVWAQFAPRLSVVRDR